jgi:hypothetical protein
LEFVGAIPFFFFKYVLGSKNFNAYLIDLMCLLGMFFIYKMNEMANTRSGDNFLKFLHLTPQHSQKMLKRQDKKARPFKVDGSIYNMALYSLIDPVLIDEWNTDLVEMSDGKVTILKNAKMTDKEKDGIFFGLTIIIGIQLTTIFLISKEFLEGLKNPPLDDYWILIPRMISSFYMHSTLAAELINGLDTMKYVVNHPYHFQRRALDDDAFEGTSKESGWYIRYFYAFMLGFSQYFLTVILELMTIIFINSQTSYLFILLFYAALAGVTTFDNMYANALPVDHSIKKVVG